MEPTATTGATTPREILERLVRFPTVNPPGDERDCVLYVRDVLAAGGIESQLLAKDPARPNLIARLPGRGEAPPLLLYGHVDVVPVADQAWSVPPFDAVERDGFIWGRGTLDDKGSVAMKVGALLRARARGLVPAGDVILAVLADEEAGGLFGASFLVDEHPDLFAGVRYGLEEAGGFTVHFSGRRIYPIQVGEKQHCVLSVTFRGRGGHGSFRHTGGATAKLGRALTTLDRRRLPVHVTEPVRLMIESIADALPRPQGTVLRRLCTPALTDRVLRLAGPQAARVFDPLLHNTVSPVIVRGGVRHNVVPSEVELVLDGRILPGFDADDLLREVRGLLGPDAEVRVESFEPCPFRFDPGLLDTLGAALRAQDPRAIPVPYVTMATTDGRHFGRLGIASYGFTPMELPAGYDFATMAHGADERIPVGAVDWGTDVVYRVLETYAG
jgi:acetylornithine deacetylase/succinyl-diaminopimelate desuccinylase-like protein